MHSNAASSGSDGLPPLLPVDMPHALDVLQALAELYISARSICVSLIVMLPLPSVLNTTAADLPAVRSMIAGRAPSALNTSSVPISLAGD